MARGAASDSANQACSETTSSALLTSFASKEDESVNSLPVDGGTEYIGEGHWGKHKENDGFGLLYLLLLLVAPVPGWSYRCCSFTIAKVRLESHSFACGTLHPWAWCNRFEITRSEPAVPMSLSQLNAHDQNRRSQGLQSQLLLHAHVFIKIQTQKFKRKHA
jgi:hypothetical protein